MTFETVLERLRRFLRDPDGAIHDDATLKRWWHQAERELAQRTGILERVETYRYPPEYTWAYVHDWEYGYLDGDRLQVFGYRQPDDVVTQYPWEAFPNQATESDEGDRFTHPWEAAYATSPEPLPVPFHRLFLQARYVAYDEEEVVPLSRREIASQDAWYRTRTGEPSHYYPLDETLRLYALYPQPSVVLTDYALSETFDDDGGIVLWQDGDYDTSDVGLVTETIDTENALFVVAEMLPLEIADNSDEIDTPEWAARYAEAGVLERAFGSDTETFIPSLRDYWGLRRLAGIEALRRFRRQRVADQDFVMGGERRRTRRSIGPAMPDHYPEPWR